MNTAEQFKNSGYLVIKNLVDISEVQRLYDYTLQNISHGNLKDGQVPGSPSFYQDKEMSVLHQKLLPQIEELTQLPLATTFCYYRTYRKGAILKSHKDRRACEISVSMNLGQQGELWDLWLFDYDDNVKNISLSPGDAVIYRGCDLAHGRGKLVNADFVSQVFFHFINKNSKKRIALQTELLNRFLARCRKIFGITY